MSNTSPSALLPNKKNVNSLWGKREVASIRGKKKEETQKLTKKKNRKNLNDIWLDAQYNIQNWSLEVITSITKPQVGFKLSSSKTYIAKFVITAENNFLSL